MNNYQLYRTNVFLGGQMKYDVILSNIDGELKVDDFHITPISPRIPYSVKVEDNLLNNFHQENIRDFYKQISGSFFKQLVDPNLSTPYPLISEGYKSYDDTYIMGCKMNTGSIYNRNIEFLCPLWLEEVNENDNIKFVFEGFITSKDNNHTQKIFKKELILNLSENDGSNNHDKFTNYLYNYLKFLGMVAKASDYVMNIDPIKNTFYITGLNVESGLIQTKQLPHLLSNLFSREIPLIEFDNDIIQTLQSNKLIVKNLFNFNFCFNIEQLIDPIIARMISDKDINMGVEVNVFLGDNQLKIKDLYSNFEYIPKKFCGGYGVRLFSEGNIESCDADFKADLIDRESFKDPNVLDYLYDYKCIDYIDKNKITQPIIHWSLYDNNDYIFNAYNGFSGYNIKNKEIININHKYDNTPNLLYSEYNIMQNTSNWCNRVTLYIDENRPIKDIRLTGTHLNKILKEYGTIFGKDLWVNGIKLSNQINIDYTQAFLMIDYDYSNIDIAEIITSKEIIYQRKNFYIIKTEVNGVSYIIFFGDKETLDNMTFGKTISILKNIESMQDLVSFMEVIKKQTINDLNVIKPQTSLDLYIANSPSLSTNEITYSKSSNSGIYIERYFGKIKPTFIDIKDNDINFNYKYSKISITDDVKNILSRYGGSNHQPLYPSIGYYFLNKNIENYENIRSFAQIKLNK